MIIFLIGVAIYGIAFGLSRRDEIRRIDQGGLDAGLVVLTVVRTTKGWQFWRTPSADLTVSFGGAERAGYFGANADQVGAYRTAVRHLAGGRAS